MAQSSAPHHQAGPHTYSHSEPARPGHKHTSTTTANRSQYAPANRHGTRLGEASLASVTSHNGAAEPSSASAAQTPLDDETSNAMAEMKSPPADDQSLTAGLSEADAEQPVPAPPGAVLPLLFSSMLTVHSKQEKRRKSARMRHTLSTKNAPISMPTETSGVCCC